MLLLSYTVLTATIWDNILVCLRRGIVEISAHTVQICAFNTALSLDVCERLNVCIPFGSFPFLYNSMFAKLVTPWKRLWTVSQPSVSGRT